MEESKWYRTCTPPNITEVKQLAPSYKMANSEECHDLKPEVYISGIQIVKSL